MLLLVCLPVCLTVYLSVSVSLCLLAQTHLEARTNFDIQSHRVKCASFWLVGQQFLFAVVVVVSQCCRQRARFAFYGNFFTFYSFKFKHSARVTVRVTDKPQG